MAGIQQPSALPGQPTQPGQPGRIHVHHSYIWLGSIRVMFTVLAVMLVSGFSGLMRTLSQGEALASTNMPAFLAAIGLGLLGFLLLIALVAFMQWWSYKHLYYELGAEEFNLYSGIFNKKRVHVPYQRIQSVDQHATLMQRIFGVCTVSIDTAGGSANKAVTVPYVQKAQAEELRRELFARKQYAVAVQEGAVVPAGVASLAGVVSPAEVASVGASAAVGAPPLAGSSANVLDAPAEIWQDVRGVFGGSRIDTGEVTYECGLTNKELILTGLSNNTAFLVVVVGIIGAIGQFAGEMLPIFSGSAEPLVGSAVAASAQLFGGNVIAAGVAAFLFGAVVLWIISAVGTCLSYGGFRARRRDNRIEVEHGLLQHQFRGVDVSRVQFVMVKQSFIRRLMGYCELSLGKIDAATDGSDENKGLSQQGVVVHPFVKVSRVPEILAGIIPEFADVPAESTPVAPVALRRALIRRCILQGSGFWLAVCVAIFQIVGNAVIDPSAFGWSGAADLVNWIASLGYLLCGVLFVFDVVGAVLWFRGSGFAFNERFMQVSNGGLARETVSFPRKKIQFGYTKTNPFQRRAHTATIEARTAAGIGGTTVRLIDARTDDAQAWLVWLQPQGNVIQ